MEHNKIVINYFIYFIVLYSLSYLLTFNHKVSIIYCSIVIISVINNYLFDSNKIERFRTYDLIKGTLVFTALIVYVIYNNFYKNNNKDSFLLTLLLILNISMIGLGELSSPHLVDKLNGFLLIITSLYTPKLIYKKKYKLYGFSDNYLWIITNTILLLQYYIFSDLMYQNDWRFSGIIAIILPLLSIFIQGNQFYWISFRIFCLSLTLLVSSIYPKLYQILHGNIYQNITDFTEKEYKNYKYIFSLISLILSILVINQNNKSIFLDYFYS